MIGSPSSRPQPHEAPAISVQPKARPLQSGQSVLMRDRSGMTELKRVEIPVWAYGHPGVAFGGLVAGLLAGGLDAARVSFRSKASPGTTVRIVTGDGGHRYLLGEAETPVADATLDDLAFAMPAVVPAWDDAVAARSRFGALPHPQPACFGCGPHRPGEPGLRVFTAPVIGAGVVAGSWKPPADLCVAGVLPREFAWAALDCPGGWARRLLAGRSRPALTVSLAVKVSRDLVAGGDYVASGWVVNDDSERKTVVGSALHERGGQLCAVAEAVLVEPRTSVDLSSAT